MNRLMEKNTYELLIKKFCATFTIVTLSTEFIERNLSK